jgi:hypothetical protein
MSPANYPADLADSTHGSKRDTDSRGHVLPTTSNPLLSSGSRRSFPRLTTPHRGGPGLTTKERAER